jgi:hypothetical protein
MAARKTAEQIKEEILFCLNNSPLSIEQIRKKVESNWSTISTYLEELSKEGKVKEIISADKAKIYQRVFGDTYFDIPITEDERKNFKTLFSLIIQEYKKFDQTPNKTQLTKAAVKVINSKESGLSNLPTAWYLYGVIPLMIADPSKEYLEEIQFEHKTKINNLIESYIKENNEKRSRQLQKEQHLEYNDALYCLADSFLDEVQKSGWDKKAILDILNDFFIACPIDNTFPEIFDSTEMFLSTVRKLSYFDSLESHRIKILLTFDALWKFIATYKFYKTLSAQKRFLGKENLVNLYLGNALSLRKSCAQEAISDLYSVYWSKLDNREIKELPQTKKIKAIMAGWTGED